MIHRTTALLSALLMQLCSGCVTTHWSRVSNAPRDGAQIAKVQNEDGTTTEWRVQPGRGKSAPRLERNGAIVRTVPRIGVRVGSIDSSMAERFGLTAWRGVRVLSVSEGRPAALAGIVPGDVILEIEARAVSSASEFSDVLGSAARTGEPIELTIEVRRRGGDPIDPVPARVTVTPIAESYREATTDSFELERSVGVQNFTGLQAAQIPIEQSREAYGVDHPVVLVSGVAVGSPAYDAGFRSGDRILRCEGRAVETLDDLRAVVGQRVRALDASLTLQDLAVPSGSVPPGNGPVSLSVEGPLGAWTADLDVRDDLDESTRFVFPILTDYRGSVHRTRWSFLDFILQFGFNYRSDVLPSATREPVTSSTLSILPFGMFEFENGPDGSESTFFWFIRFRSDR